MYIIYPTTISNRLFKYPTSIQTNNFFNLPADLSNLKKCIIEIKVKKYYLGELDLDLLFIPLLETLTPIV